MSRFDIRTTSLEGVLLLDRRPIADERGFLERLYAEDELGELLGGKPIRQVNRTLTKARGAIRGMHFQRAPHSEIKLVHCLSGTIFDVAVDLRVGSPTFGKWHGVKLSGATSRTFIVPVGFAHGFQALTENCEMLYFHTAAFAKHAEGGVSPFDPTLAIDRPLDVTDISERDRTHPAIDDGFQAL